MLRVGRKKERKKEIKKKNKTYDIIQRRQDQTTEFPYQLVTDLVTPFR